MPMFNRRSPHTSSSGAGSGDAKCEQLPFVSRLAVDNPSSLLREPWLEHLQACAECREEAADHSRALGIFRSIDSERLSSKISTLTWESVQAAIQREESEAHTHSRSRAWWGIPMAAAAAGALAAVAVLGWDAVMDDGQPAPARIVRVEAPQQRSMEQVMRWTLGTWEPRSDLAPAPTGVETHFEDLELGRSLLEAPEARELAASVSPLMQENVSLERESPLIVPARNSILSAGERRSPNSPTAGRSGSIPPLFRLEHRLILTQPVSLSVHD